GGPAEEGGPAAVPATGDVGQRLARGQLDDRDSTDDEREGRQGEGEQPPPADTADHLGEPVAKARDPGRSVRVGTGRAGRLIRVVGGGRVVVTRGALASDRRYDGGHLLRRVVDRGAVDEVGEHGDDARQRGTDDRPGHAERGQQRGGRHGRQGAGEDAPGG